MDYRDDKHFPPMDQPPAGDYRVVYYVTEGGLSDRPERTGQEVQRLELPLESNAYGTADLALAWWHLDCQAGASQRIEMHPMRWLAYLYQPFQITSSSGPCVNQGDLTAVDCVSGATIELMPFSPATFCLKAITSDGSTAPYTVKLVSYDENGFPILQPTAPDWERPCEIPVTLLYNDTLGYHISPELEAQLPEAGGSGMSSLFLPLSLQILQQQTQGVLDFFISEIGSLLAGGAGAANLSFPSLILLTDSNYSLRVPFDQIIGRNDLDHIYVKALLANPTLSSKDNTYTVTYCLNEPGWGEECDEPSELELTLQGASNAIVVEYRGEMDLPVDETDTALEYALFDTSDPEDGRAFVNGMIAVPPYPEGVFSRGLAKYLIGKIANGTICDQANKPCHTDANDAALRAQIANPNRIHDNRAEETPYLDENFVRAGGLRIIEVHLGTSGLSDKGWFQDQADIVYFSGHGWPNGDIALRYNKTQLINPLTHLDNQEWQIDMGIVIFSACDELSLCDDEAGQDKDNGDDYDPRCAVTYDTPNGPITQYNSAHPPNNNWPCLHCTGGSDSFGGQKWRNLTQLLGDGTVVGPKLYLGYYNEAPYGPQRPNNTDTEIMAGLMNCLHGRGGFSDANPNFDAWRNCWLSANLNVEQPAAVIDARDPDNMQYWAVFQWLNPQTQQLEWTSDRIYPDLDTNRP